MDEVVDCKLFTIPDFTKTLLEDRSEMLAVVEERLDTVPDCTSRFWMDAVVELNDPTTPTVAVMLDDDRLFTEPVETVRF
jgi:hypothetical protein